ncbi:MAG: hypothetical protein Fur0035_11250 [Anaerolineales bacterium]
MNWHKRYQQQAVWTKNAREYLWRKTGLDSAQRVLELGCGTGAILETLPRLPGRCGLDLNLGALRQAQFNAPGASLTQGAGEFLPFAAATFDLVFCHFLLLWAADPAAILREMARVTRPGGALLALAEPDYAARIDEPPELAELGRWQSEALTEQGINPRMGRQLAGAFAEAGIPLIESGIHGAAWGFSDPGQAEQEWAVTEADLAGKIPGGELNRLKNLEEQARQSGRRVLFVPTFYAWGAV